MNLVFSFLVQIQKGDRKFLFVFVTLLHVELGYTRLYSFLPSCSNTRVQSELIKQEKQSTLTSCRFHLVSLFFLFAMHR